MLRIKSKEIPDSRSCLQRMGVASSYGPKETSADTLGTAVSPRLTSLSDSVYTCSNSLTIRISNILTMLAPRVIPFARRAAVRLPQIPRRAYSDSGAALQSEAKKNPELYVNLTSIGEETD
jgi:hypothetical protein